MSEPQWDYDKLLRKYEGLKKKLQIEIDWRKWCLYESRKYFDKTCQDYISQIDRLKAELKTYETSDKIYKRRIKDEPKRSTAN